MEIYKKHFGKKLKQAINQAGLKQFELADKLDVNPAAISHWVSGKDFPDDSRIEKICSVLHVDLNYFGYGKTEMSAMELLDLLQENRESLFLIPRIPKDILKLLSVQDDIVLKEIRVMLEKLEEKKAKKHKNTNAV